MKPLGKDDTQIPQLWLVHGTLLGVPPGETDINMYLAASFFTISKDAAVGLTSQILTFNCLLTFYFVSLFVAKL